MTLPDVKNPDTINKTIEIAKVIADNMNTVPEVVRSSAYIDWSHPSAILTKYYFPLRVIILY